MKDTYCQPNTPELDLIIVESVNKDQTYLPLQHSRQTEQDIAHFLETKIWRRKEEVLLTFITGIDGDFIKCMWKLGQQ